VGVWGGVLGVYWGLGVCPGDVGDGCGGGVRGVLGSQAAGGVGGSRMMKGLSGSGGVEEKSGRGWVGGCQKGGGAVRGRGSWCVLGGESWGGCKSVCVRRRGPVCCDVCWFLGGDRGEIEGTAARAREGSSGCGVGQQNGSRGGWSECCGGKREW